MRSLEEIVDDVTSRADMSLIDTDAGSVSFRYRYVSTRGKRSLAVRISANDYWENISVSGGSQLPSQSAMRAVQRFVMEPDEWMMQLYIPAEMSVHEADTTIHLWRPCSDALPLPPASLVVDPKLGAAGRI